MATFVRRGTKYALVNLGKEQESLVVKIWTGKEQITIINYYNPCNVLNISILENTEGQAQGKIVWCGDFNAHSTLGK